MPYELFRTSYSYNSFYAPLRSVLNEHPLDVLLHIGFQAFDPGILELKNPRFLRDRRNQGLVISSAVPS